MAVTRSTWLKRLAILPPVAIGIVVLVLQMRGREAPEQFAPSEIARPVRVLTVQPMDFVPRAVGYGSVQPRSVWNGVAQVPGKVIERHPDLDAGTLFDAGTVLLRIDPADYELARAQTAARIASVHAELAELAAREANTQSSIEIEQRALALADADLDRKRTLLRRGNVSQAAVDEAERLVLTQRQRLQELTNLLNLVPAQRQVLKANLAVNEAQLEEARLNLDRTRVILPFDARIAATNVEENQFVNIGEVLVVADSIDIAEIPAQVPIEQMAQVVPRDIVPAGLTTTELGRLADRLAMDAIVHLRTGAVDASWRARVDRISPAIDPQTRTIGVYVAVDEPYRQAIPGQRPPLIKNMYVQVELFGRARPESLVIPRIALHRAQTGPRVYLADENDRLVIREVRAGPHQGDLVVIDAGLEAGERIVVTDLIPAITGMLLAPHDDTDLMRRLREDASRQPGASPDASGHPPDPDATTATGLGVDRVR